MENKKIYLGSHVGMNGPEYYLGSVKEAISYGSNTFMFYTGAPQNSYRKPLSELKIEEGRKLLLESGFDEYKLVVHAPYIINGANRAREDILDLAKQLILSEVQRTAGFHAHILVLHPGSHVNLGEDVGIDALVECLDDALSKDKSDVKIALETMAGKGSEIGITFEQIAQIIEKCAYKDRLGVCLDTCHISDAGYDVHDVDGVLEEFNRIIGLDRLLVIHLNDSKNPRGAHKDRHENLGYGYVGFETIHKWATHPKLDNIPKILETPYINEKAPYKKEVAMLRNGEFINNWKEEFEN
ncbi:MAG: deoxyribonuclease IV [Bacilli bacterium]|nr:deoxyribonuclease IV [Bacilli bacterium]